MYTYWFPEDSAWEILDSYSFGRFHVYIRSEDSELIAPKIGHFFTISFEKKYKFF